MSESWVKSQPMYNMLLGLQATQWIQIIFCISHLHGYIICIWSLILGWSYMYIIEK
jgi:hypothetical protein